MPVTRKPGEPWEGSILSQARRPRKGRIMGVAPRACHVDAHLGRRYARVGCRTLLQRWGAQLVNASPVRSAANRSRNVAHKSRGQHCRSTGAREPTLVAPPVGVCEAKSLRWRHTFPQPMSVHPEAERLTMLPRPANIRHMSLQRDDRSRAMEPGSAIAMRPESVVHIAVRDR
jgi:hypothetical protein